jgi:hypothetical protein
MTIPKTTATGTTADSAPHAFKACGSSGCIRFINGGDGILIYSDSVGTVPFVEATDQEFLDLYDGIRNGDGDLHQLADKVRARLAAEVAS